MKAMRDLYAAWKTAFGDLLPPGLMSYDVEAVQEGYGSQKTLDLMRTALWAASVRGAA